ncbi:MAG: response regulator [Bacteroidota bacterium]|nr:response regulator [Bacteroidota bacterium]
MKPAKILIVEDKAVIAESLAATLEDAGYIVTAKITSGEEALATIEKEMPDVILMDIELDGKMDGIQTAELLLASYKIPIIYLTNFDDKTTIDRAKSTCPAAYLLKPFKKNDLLIAIEIAFHNASTGKEAVAGAKENLQPVETISPFTDRFFVRDNEIMVRINLTDIYWIKADRTYYEIKTLAKSYNLVGNLKLFSQKFSHPMLIRVHRSYIVNLDKVIAIRGNMLLFGDNIKAEISISETYRDEVNKRLPMV